MASVPSVTSAFRARPAVVDVALAVVLAVIGVVEAASTTREDASVPVLVATALVMTVPLAWRRTGSILVLGVVLGGVAMQTAAGVSPESVIVTLPTTALASYSVALHSATRRLAWRALVVALAIAYAVVAIDAAGEMADLVFVTLLVAAPWAAGFALRDRIAESEALGERAERAEREREERARAAVVEERARIARELHDVVAHGISIIAVQAGAAEELIARDEDEARRSMRAVQTTARSALAEMRRLLELLRVEGDESARGPQPGLAALGDLVEQVRIAGLDVQVEHEGTPQALPPGVDLAAYRIVQEALTNALKHAGSVAVTVRVIHDERAIGLEVVNQPGASTGTTRGTGHGLVGMRERVVLYGGTIETGPRPSGGFAVRARLPVGAPA